MHSIDGQRREDPSSARRSPMRALAAGSGVPAAGGAMSEPSRREVLDRFPAWLAAHRHEADRSAMRAVDAG